MALPGTNAETPIDSHRLDGSLWKPHSILSYPEGHFNPPSDLTLTKAELNKPFPFEEELATKSTRLGELNAMLDIDKQENAIVDGDRSEEDVSSTPEHSLER